MPQSGHSRPGVEGGAGDVESQVEHSPAAVGAFDDERCIPGAVQHPTLEVRDEVEVEGRAGGQRCAESVPCGVAVRQAHEAERQAGQQHREARRPEQAVVRAAGDGQDAAPCEPLREGVVLTGAQALEGLPVHHEGGHAVVARPVFGEPLQAWVQHPHAPAPVVVQVVQVGIAAENQDHAGIGDPGAQVDRLAGKLPSAGEDPDFKGLREALQIDGEWKALARSARQIERAPMDVDERPAAELVAVRHPHFEMTVDARAAVFEGDAEGGPGAEAIDAGESERGLDVHSRARGELRHAQRHAVR